MACELLRDADSKELEEDDFADMFAQTLAYELSRRGYRPGRRARRLSHAEALLAVPKSNPFLRKIFPSLPDPTCRRTSIGRWMI